MFFWEIEMKKIKQKFDEALKQFTEKQSKNPNVIAVLVSGSYIHSKPDKNSDLDVYVLLKESKTRERGNTWINNIEIEYFINPVKQVRHYFKTEIDQPSTAHMFANSKILYKKGNAVNELIKEAKRIIKKPTKKMSKIDIEFAKYFIDDMEKDLEDVYLKKDKFAFFEVANEILGKSLELFFKIKRKTKEKSKRLKAQLKTLDKKFANLYSSAITETNMDKKYKKVKKLAQYVEDYFGGKRPKEWKITSKCTYERG